MSAKRKIDYRTKYLGTERARKVLWRKNEEWNAAYYDLLSKYQEAVSKLQDLSSGFYPADMPESWSYPNKLQASAARTLRKLATMKQREAP